ncbi:MAG: zf-HC2 domain-containing protein [Actinomycetota bacterium]
MNRFFNMLFRRGLTCAEVMELLQAYLDNESSTPEEALEVAKHLENCKACDREAQVYKDIKASIAARQRPVDPEILTALRQYGQDLMINPAD